MRVSTCITTRSDEDTETSEMYKGYAWQSSCITTRSDEDTETTHLWRGQSASWTCITTRSDEDTETNQCGVQEVPTENLHHHPIR